MKNRIRIKETILGILTSENKDRGKAVFLDGPWGCGKTYLWKNDISFALKKAQHKSVYISLFGINSIEDIRSKIITNYLSVSLTGKEEFCGHATGVAASKTARSLLKNGIAKLEEKYLGTALTKELLGYWDPLAVIKHNTIFCIDDLERMSDKVSIEEVLGLFDYLTEEKKANLLIIGNIKKFQQIDRFKDFKERVFASYIKVGADIELIYDLLCENRKNSLLLKKKKLIVDIFLTSKCENFRTLQRVLYSIEDICSKKIRLDDCHLCTLTAWIIAKDNNRLRNKDFYDFTPYKSLLKGELGQNEKDFLKEYFTDETDYKYIEALYDYVEMEYIEDKKKMLEEIRPPKKRYNRVQKMVAVVTSETNVFFLSDNDTIALIKKIQKVIMEEQEMTLYQLVTLIVYVRLLSERMGIEKDCALDSKIETILKLAAKKDAGDKKRELGYDHVLMYYNTQELASYWTPYYEQYKKMLSYEKAKRMKREALSIISDAKMKDVYEIEQREGIDFFNCFFETEVMDELANKMTLTPDFFYRMVGLLFERTKRKEEIESFINKIMKDRSLQKMEMFRLKTLCSELHLSCGTSAEPTKTKASQELTHKA